MLSLLYRVCSEYLYFSNTLEYTSLCRANKSLTYVGITVLAVSFFLGEQFIPIYTRYIDKYMYPSPLHVAAKLVIYNNFTV